MCIPVVQILTSSFTVRQVFQGLTRAYIRPTSQARPFPADILYDPRSEAMVLNGKAGHIQFYSVHEDTQLFNVST